MWNSRWRNLCQHFINILNASICKGKSSCTSNVLKSEISLLPKPVPNPVIPNSGKVQPPTSVHKKNSTSLILVSLIVHTQSTSNS